MEKWASQVEKKNQELSAEVSLFSESTTFDELKRKVAFQLVQVSLYVMSLSAFSLRSRSKDAFFWLILWMHSGKCNHTPTEKNRLILKLVISYCL